MEQRVNANSAIVAKIFVAQEVVWGYDLMKAFQHNEAAEGVTPKSQNGTKQMQSFCKRFRRLSKTRFSWFLCFVY